MPSLNAFETDMKKMRRKRRTKRTIKNVSFIMAVVIIAGLIYLSRDAWISYFDGILERAKQTNVTTVQNDGSLAGGNYPIDISKKTHTAIGKIAKNWTLFADTTFYVYDPSGEIIYSVQAPYANPIVVESDKRALVYDQGGYNFTVAGQKKEVYTKKLTDQILLGAIGSNGSVAIVTANEKFQSYLTIYDKDGSEIYHWADGTMITSVAVNQNGSGCILASSYARNGGYQTVVTQLDFSSTETVMQSQPFDTLGFKLGYCSGGMWLIGQDKAIELSDDGSAAQTYRYSYALSDVALSEKTAALVFEDIDGSGSNIAIMSSGGKSTFETKLDTAVSSVFCDSRAVYFNLGQRIDAYDSAGQLLATAPVDSVYRSFTVLDGSVYLLGYHSVDKIDYQF